MGDVWVPDIQNCSREIWSFRGNSYIPVFWVAEGTTQGLLATLWLEQIRCVEDGAGIIHMKRVGTVARSFHDKVKDPSLAEAVRNRRAKTKLHERESRLHFLHCGWRGGPGSGGLQRALDTWDESVQGRDHLRIHLHAADHGSWGGVVHKQSSGVMAHTSEHCRGRFSTTLVGCGGERTSESHRSSPWKKEPSLRHVLCHYWMWLCTLSFLLICLSLQLRRDQRQQWVAREEWKNKAEKVVKMWPLPLSSLPLPSPGQISKPETCEQEDGKQL